MPTVITFVIGEVRLSGELNDSAAGRAIAGMLPLKVRMSRWGEEYYGALPKGVAAGESGDAREVMEVGELAYWAPGNALCLFFGPTPASEGSEPRAASPVEPVGRVGGDLARVRAMGAEVQGESM